MENTLNNKILIFDFDSTFVKVETIDLLADISLKNDPNAKEKINLISEITKKAMSGDIEFPTALEQRLSVLSLNKDNLTEATQEITNLVTDSFKRNKEMIKSLSDDIWIVSGGFKEVICPVVADYGISPKHVMANSFIYDGDRISGCDRNSFVFQKDGKAKFINALELNRYTIMIGDGYTDLEVFLSGATDEFICFTENVKRYKVIEKSRYVASDLDKVIEIVNKI